MSNVLERDGVWEKIIVGDPDSRYPVNFPYCARCGYVPRKGEIMWRHRTIFRKKSRPKRKIDYRCEKCYEEIWYEGGVRSWMKKFLNVQNVIKK